MIKWFFLYSLAMGLASPSLSAERPIRVLVWDEQQPEQRKAYGDKFLGETIAKLRLSFVPLSNEPHNVESRRDKLSSIEVEALAYAIKKKYAHLYPWPSPRP